MDPITIFIILIAGGLSTLGIHNCANQTDNNINASEFDYTHRSY